MTAPGDAERPLPPRAVRFRFARRFLLVALAADLVLIAIWLALLGPEGSRDMPRPFRIEVDGSLGEIGNYLKYVVAGVLLWRAGPGHRGIALVFAILLLDDAGNLHERLGDAIGDVLGVSDDIGELGGFALLGLPVLMLLARGWMRSDAAGRAGIAGIAVILAALTVCGIGADLAASFFGGAARLALILVEEGGEMIFTSLLAAQALGLRSRG